MRTISKSCGYDSVAHRSHKGHIGLITEISDNLDHPIYVKPDVRPDEIWVFMPEELEPEKTKPPEPAKAGRKFSL